jgi:hypothetical protein
MMGRILHDMYLEQDDFEMDYTIGGPPWRFFYPLEQRTMAPGE